MLESRNERVYIMLLAYVIGFVTAYIGFGLNQSQPAPVVFSAVESVVEDKAVLLASTNGLEFIKDGERTLLSADQSLLNEPLVEDTPGIHQSLAEFELSNSSQYVYFCEVPVLDGTHCRAYQYDVSADVVTPIKVDGEQLQLDPVPHEVTWSDQGVSSVAGIVVN